MKRPPRRLTDRLFALLGVRLVVWLVAASTFLAGPLSDPPNRMTTHQDDHGALMHEEAARKTYVEYHQLPAWNPYYCGGILGLANAPDSEAAPDFLFRILFGTFAGRRVTALFFVVLGMEGVFRWARRNGASGPGAAMAAVAFSTSGHFVNLMQWGWIFMFNYNLVPWAVLSYEEGLRKRAWWIAGGFFMAWIVLGGGTYVAPYAGLALAMTLVAETIAALREKTMPWWHPTATLAKMAAVAVGFAALRLLPLAQLLLTHSRPVEQKDQTAPLTVFAWLALRRTDNWSIGGGDYYVGILVFALAMIALLLRSRRAPRFFLMAAIFAALACGEFSDRYSPYLWLHKLPIYSQLRFPDRLTTMAGLCLAVAGALGLTAIEDGLTSVLGAAGAWLTDKLRTARVLPMVKLAAALAGGAVAAKLAWVAAADVVETNRIRPGAIYVMEGPQTYADEFRQARGNRWDGQIWPFANRGSLHCFEEHQLFTSPGVRGDLPQEEYPAPESRDVTVERVRWSPNEIVLHVRAPAGGRFLVNQNHNDAWHTDVGELSSDGGLISVRVPPGDHRVTLYYRDWRMVAGGVVTAGTLGWVLWLAQRRTRRRAAAWQRLWRLLGPRAKSVRLP